MARSAPLIDLANEFPLLEVEVRSASQAEAVRLMHEGSVHLALVFERPGIDERENFLEAGSRRLTAVAAPDYLRRMEAQGMVEARQIIVAAGSPSATDPQMILSHHLWLTDSDLATLNLVQVGLGWAYLPHPLVAALIESGNLRAVAFDNMANQLRLWVDIVWSSNRPHGLGARRYLELIRAHGWATVAWLGRADIAATGLSGRSGAIRSPDRRIPRCAGR